MGIKPALLIISIGLLAAAHLDYADASLMECADERPVVSVPAPKPMPPISIPAPRGLP